MKKLISLIIISIFSIFMTQQSAFALQTKTTYLGLNSIDKMKPAGTYDIYVQKDNNWQMAGSLGYDRFIRERVLDISSMIAPADNKIKIRIVQNGGGAAHIDSVLLGGKAPLSSSGAPLAKINKRDNDVADASGKTIELEFADSGSLISLMGRIENKIISEEPFKYPAINTYRKIDINSRFYRYKPGSQNKQINIDGKIDEISSHKPFFKEMSFPSSGHPAGYTYGWVSNDSENLYAAIDFTPDNTMDGGKDYTAVYVKTKSAVNEYRVSELQKQWGLPAFCYTDKVGYQHKTYEFKIPLKEIGLNKNDEIELAFSAYGTAAVLSFNQRLSYDSVNNRFLVVYYESSGPNYYGQFLNPDGTAYGSSFQITDSNANVASPTPTMVSIAYDYINKRFLAAWTDNRDGNYNIYGQFIKSGETLSSPANFPITDNSNTQSYPKTAYDSTNQRFLVVWTDSREGSYDIYGQIVNSSGSLYGTLLADNFSICSLTSLTQQNPSLAFDKINSRFLVIWEDGRNGGYDIYGQLVNSDHTLNGTDFQITSATDNQYSPSLEFDEVNQRYMAVWYDFRDAVYYEIYGQLINANGTLFGTTAGSNIHISQSDSTNKFLPSIAYDKTNQKYLVTWHDGNNEIHGDYISSSGAQGTDFPIVTGSNAYINASVVYNPGCMNYLIAYEDSSLSDIAIKQVGSCAANSAPPAPVLLSPANNIMGQGASVTFSWTISSDPDGDPVDYNLHYSTDQKFRGTASAVIASPPALEDVRHAAVGGLGAGLLLFGLALIFKRKKALIVIPLCLAVFSLALLTCTSSKSSDTTKVTINLGGGDKAGSMPTKAIPSGVYQVLIKISAPDMDTISRTVTVAEQENITEEFTVPNGTQRLFNAIAVDKARVPVFQGSASQNLDGSPVTVSIAMIEGTVSHTLTGLTPGARYYWKVSAADGKTSTDSLTRTFITNLPGALKIISATTMDSDGNGQIDHYKIELSMNVNDSTFPGYVRNSTGTTATGWTIDPLPLVMAHGTAAPEPDIENDNIIYLGFDESGTPDTGNIPDLTVANGSLISTGGAMIADTATNDLTETDGAAPVIVSAAVNDVDRLHLNVSFSEPVISPLSLTDFIYTDISGGDASLIIELSDADGSNSIISFTLDISVTDLDENSDTISATTAVQDYNGNEAIPAAVIFLILYS